MNRFYLNNSSLPSLACSQQYKFKVIDGLKPPPGGNKYTPIGLAFHQWMKIVSDKVNVQQLTLFDRENPIIHQQIKSIGEIEQLQTAAVAQKIFSEHPEMFANCHREVYFEYDDPVANDKRCGTIDLVSLIDGVVVITDYKTTSKPLDGWLINSYKLTSQRPYYLQAALDGALDHLGDNLAIAIAVASYKLAWRYCFVNYAKCEYLLQPPDLVNLPEQAVYKRLFDEKAIYAEALHNDPSLAVKEGILSGLCWKCPYSSICAAEDSDTAAERWPYGKKQYDGKHDE